MDEIEKEYKEKNKLTDASDASGSKTTTSADSLLVRNWQDILAVYVYQQSQDGKTEFTLDSSCKKDLAKIFAEMNPIVRDKQDITHVTYANRKINYYIKKNKIAKKDRTILKKYVETDCKLLCAVVTAANGFVRESVGDDVSEERVNVISAAYSLVGKVGYFWGGIHSDRRRSRLGNQREGISRGKQEHRNHPRIRTGLQWFCHLGSDQRISG